MVLFAGNTVWFITEHIRGVRRDKLYKSTLPLLVMTTNLLYLELLWELNLLSTVFLHVIPAYFIKHSVHLFTKFWSFPLYYKILILRWILTNENIQIRLTKTIFPQLPYSERLVKLYLPILEMRRVMADLTTCYKLLNGLIDIDSDNFFVASNNTRTRGNSRKLKKIIYWISVMLICSIIESLTSGINCQTVLC